MCFDGKSHVRLYHDFMQNAQLVGTPGHITHLGYDTRYVQ